MAVQSFPYEIALLLTKYTQRWANSVQIFFNVLKKHYLGIDTLFATMSEPLTPNLQILVQSSVQV